MNPNYKITVNGSDLRQEIRGRLISLQVTDEQGIQADSLYVTFNDFDQSLAIPDGEAKIEVSLGYDNDLVFFGQYVIDEFELVGKNSLVIRGKGFDSSSTVVERKSRSFESNRLSDIARKIAEETLLELRISEEMSGIIFEKSPIQQNQSDLGFLQGLLLKYDGLVKINNGLLIISKKGSGKSISGAELSRLVIRPQDIEPDFRFRISGRDQYKEAKAYYYDPGEGKALEVVRGAGKPRFVFPDRFSNETEAIEACKAKLKESAYQSKVFTCKMEARPTVRAETPVLLQGFKREVDGEYFVKRAVHQIDSSGYTMDLECLPFLDEVASNEVS